MIPTSTYHSRSIQNITVEVDKTVEGAKHEPKDGTFIGLSLAVVALEPYYDSISSGSRTIEFRGLPVTKRAFKEIREYLQTHGLEHELCQTQFCDSEGKL